MATNGSEGHGVAPSLEALSGKIAEIFSTGKIEKKGELRNRQKLRDHATAPVGGNWLTVSDISGRAIREFRCDLQPT